MEYLILFECSAKRTPTTAAAAVVVILVERHWIYEHRP